MARWKIQVEETRHLSHIVYLETDLNEEQLDTTLDKVQAKLPDIDNLEDTMWGMSCEGLKVVNYIRDEDGYSNEIEINDMEEVEE